jgi:adenylate cyclase
MSFGQSAVRLISRLRSWLPANVIPGLALTAVLFLIQIAHLGLATEIGNLVFDAYQRVHPRPYETAPVRVVDIDDATLAKLGQWPWPRAQVAQLTSTLTDAGAAAVAYDVVFSEPDRTGASNDRLLGQTFAQTPSVIGFFLTREANSVRPQLKAGFAVSGADAQDALPDYLGSIVPLPVINDGAKGSGFVSMVGGKDGIIRSIPLVSRIENQLVPSLSIEGLRVAQQAGAILLKTTSGNGELDGGEAGIVSLKIGIFEIPTTRDGQLWMYYTDPVPQRTVPAWKILTGALSPAALKRDFADTIVIVGTGASGLRDLVATPLSDRELGAVVHAEALEQMILGRFLVRPDWAPGLERTLVLLFGVGLSLGLAPLGALRGGLIAVLAFVCMLAGSWFAFRYYMFLIDPTFPAFAILGVYLADTSFSFYREERARAHIRSAFNHYLSPEMVERIARNPGQLELGGEERDMTVMFCDIRGFSRISEKLTPHQIISFLNAFLSPLTDVLMRRKATIDKFIGDAILAFWNAPLNDPDHPRNAALATLDMLAELKVMNRNYIHDKNKTWPGEVRIGIGMNSGPCFVGNIGSAQRINYSLIGDTVNLASRIEGLTKVYGVQIAIGSELAGRISDFALLELDLVRAVGRDTAEKLFALLGPPNLREDISFRELAVMQSEMLTAYRAQNWAEADAAIAKMRTAAKKFGLEKLLHLYADRIAAYRAAPPPANWDGVHQATSK